MARKGGYNNQRKPKSQVAPVVYRRNNYHLYGQLFEPYASGRVDAIASETDVLWLSVMAFSLTLQSITIDDLLWPGTYDIGGDGVAVVRCLEKQPMTTGVPSVDASRLRQLLARRMSRGKLESAPTRLIELGIVMRSPKIATES